MLLWLGWSKELFEYQSTMRTGKALCPAPRNKNSLTIKKWFAYTHTPFDITSPRTFRVALAAASERGVRWETRHFVTTLAADLLSPVRHLPRNPLWMMIVYCYSGLPLTVRKLISWDENKRGRTTSSRHAEAEPFLVTHDMERRTHCFVTTHCYLSLRFLTDYSTAVLLLLLQLESESFCIRRVELNHPVYVIVSGYSDRLARRNHHLREVHQFVPCHNGAIRIEGKTRWWHLRSCYERPAQGDWQHRRNKPY